MRDRVEQLTRELILVFEHHPWYGEGVLEKIGKLRSEESEVVVGPTDRSIWQLVEHMITWREYAITKATTNPNYKVEIDGPVDWPVNENADWAVTLDRLKQSQSTLLEILADRDDAWLKTMVQNTEFDFEFLIQGIAHHDIYHLGQIGLLLRMLREQS